MVWTTRTWSRAMLLKGMVGHVFLLRSQLGIERVDRLPKRAQLREAGAIDIFHHRQPIRQRLRLRLALDLLAELVDGRLRRFGLVRELGPRRLLRGCNLQLGLGEGQHGGLPCIRIRTEHVGRIMRRPSFVRRRWGWGLLSQGGNAERRRGYGDEATKRVSHMILSRHRASFCSD